MSKPTEAQIKNLEKVHKTQFADLVSAIELWHRSRSNPKILPTSREKYGQSLLPLIESWSKRERRLSAKPGIKSGFATYFPTYWWLQESHLPQLQQIRNQQNAEIQQATSGKSIGFIPLLIWAAIALIAYFTVTEVVDETNNTSEEQATLVDSTNTFCKDNKLSPEECKNLLSEQNSQTNNTDSGWGFGKIIMVSLLGFAAIKYGPQLINSGKAKT